MQKKRASSSQQGNTGLKKIPIYITNLWSGWWEIFPYASK